MSKILIETKITRTMNWIGMLIGMPILGLLGLYLLIASIAKGSIIGVGMALVMFAIGVFGPLADRRYRLIVADEFVEQQYWRKVRIEYSEIGRVYVYPRCLELHGNKKKLRTLGTIQERKRVIHILADQIKRVPGIKYEGDANLIRELFGK